MSKSSTVCAADLAQSGRNPPCSFRISLGQNPPLVVRRLLRVLPGKRIVGEGEWAGQRVVAKLYVSKASQRHWAREVAGIEALRKSGLPTPAVLYADRIESGGHALLTEFIDHAVSYDEVWGECRSRLAGDMTATERLKPLIELMARMHQSGVVQEDLHFGNFLLSPAGLFMIDGDTVRDCGGPVARTMVAQNLGRFVAQLPVGWDRHLDRLLESYEAAGGVSGLSIEELSREVGRERKRRLDDYFAKCARDCTLFFFEKSASRMISAWRDALPAIGAVLKEPDHALDDGVRLKSGRTCTVARVDTKAGVFVLKRYNLKNLTHALSRAWRPSRAWHAWRAGNMLDSLGIPTPKPIAVIEERFGPLRRRAFLLTRYCEGISLLDRLSAEHVPEHAEQAAILEVFNALFGQRITHGDMKASNLLWCEGRMVLIDLDAMVQHASERVFRRAWRRDRARLLANWPESSVLRHWLDESLPRI